MREGERRRGREVRKGEGRREEGRERMRGREGDRREIKKGGRGESFFVHFFASNFGKIRFFLLFFIFYCNRFYFLIIFSN